MERLNAYTRAGPDGQGTTVDVEGMQVDLVTVLKAGIGRERDAVLD
jgi:hypothetical protein